MKKHLHVFPACKTLCGAGVLFLLWATGGGQISLVANQAQATVADAAIVEMPPYEVRADRVLPPPEKWLYVEVPALVLERGKSVLVAPGYHVLSNLSANNTKLFVNELQLRQFAGTLLWPSLVQLQPRVPGIIVLDGKRGVGERWGKTDGTEWKGDPMHADFRPNILDADAFMAGLQWIEINSAQGFATQGEIDAAGDPAFQPGSRGDIGEPLPPGFVDAAMSGNTFAAWVRAGVPLANVTRPSEERLAAAVCEEQMSLLMSSLPQRPPPWFLFGMRRLIASTEVSPTKISFARIGFVRPSRVQSNIAPTAQALVDGLPSPPLSVPSVMSVAPIHLPPLLPVLNKAESLAFEDIYLSSAFVHYGFYGMNGKYRQKIMALVERQTAGEEVTDTLFKDVFGFDSKKMLSILSTYIRDFSAYTYHEMRGKIPPMPEIEMHEAAQSEAARLQAEAHGIQGRLDLALDKLRIAYWRGERRDTGMLTLLAEMEERIGSVSRVEKIMKALAGHSVTSPRLPYVQARLRYRSATSGKPESEKLSPGESAPILNLLIRAVNAGYVTEDLCEFFSDVVMRSAELPREGVAQFLNLATKRFPRNEKVAAAMGCLQNQDGSKYPQF